MLVTLLATNQILRKVCFKSLKLMFAYLRKCAEGTQEPSGRSTRTMIFQPQSLVLTVSEELNVFFYIGTRLGLGFCKDQLEFDWIQVM